MDEMEYLQPSFDPSTLTMPRLRNILMTHNIHYPASAKKAELVNTFNQDLKPQARKLLSARDKVRRTSRGITDMPSSQEGTVDGDDEGRSSIPPPAQRSQTARRSTRSSTEDRTFAEDSSTSRTPGGKRRSNKHARHSDTETDTDVPKLVKKGRPRKSEATPNVKLEESEQTLSRPSMPKSAFSNENPFQSGSSPLTAEANRRRSAGTSNTSRNGPRSSSSRRKTDGFPSTRIKQEGDAVVPTSNSFEMPASALTNAKGESGDIVEAGEEFAPDQQLELVRGQVTDGRGTIRGSKKLRRPKKSSIPRSAPWLLVSTLLVGYATWYRQEKISVGYCGIGTPSHALSNIEVPEWASALVPTCEPCPQHAVCYEGMETRCEDGFILQSHPLSLGGVVPVPPACEPDGAKARRVKAVADRAIETLRERKAHAECGTLKDEDGKDVPAAIPEQDLKKEVGKSRNRAMSAREFEDLWKDAIGEIVGREEVISSDEG